MTDPKYAAFTALDPFFDIVQQGLAGLVDGDHYFDTIADDAASTCRSTGANRHSEEPSLVGRKCSNGFTAWSGALRGVKAAKSETSVQKFKSRQQWLSHPLPGFAVTNQSGRQDGY